MSGSQLHEDASALEIWFPSQQRYYRDPVEIIEARDAPSLLAALRRCDAVLQRGSSIAGYVTYEAGVLLEGRGGAPRHPVQTPLLVLGCFDGPHRGIPQHSDNIAELGPLVTTTTWDAYADSVTSIKRSIYDGQVYQVNLTVPFFASFSGDVFALFCTLVDHAKVPHAAFVRHGRRAIVSCSPELFLEVRDSTVRTKPMKGTSQPEMTGVLSDDKNRAEHVMIVDLMRNDLGRLGTVPWTTGLFTIETYPTFKTLTTTVETALPPDASLSGLFAATMPAGSITGAPKHAAIAQIAGLEESARDIAMGTIGFQDGPRRGMWNVAIRTLDIDTERGIASVRIGGGIVGDSLPETEWAEILVKRRVFDAVASSGGLIETLRVTSSGVLIRLDSHLARLERSAFAFGLRLSIDAARSAFRTAAQVARDRDALLRLVVDASGMHIAERQLDAVPADITVTIASQRVDPADPERRHKTTRRRLFDAALVAATNRGSFEAVLCSVGDTIADGARTTVFVERDGVLLTPPVERGALPGILRAELIASGEAIEYPLTCDDLRAGDFFIGNSARGLLRARLQSEREPPLQ